jgi:hypothetical protein
MANLSFIDGTPEFFDIRDLITNAEEIAEVLNDPEEHDADDVASAQDDLDALKEILKGCGYYGKAIEDADDVVDTLNTLMDYNGVTLYRDDMMDEYAEELYGSELGDVSEEIKWAVDWEKLAEHLRQGVSYTFKVNGAEYNLL